MHSPEFINSDFTISSDADVDKISSAKAAAAANVPMYVFLYMDGCGHCVAAEAAWVTFTKKCADRSDAAAYAVSHAAMGAFGSLFGEVPSGFPTFRHVHAGKVTEYTGDRTTDGFSKWASMTEQSGGRSSRRRRGSRRRRTTKRRRDRKARKARKARKTKRRR
jgi:hypothetical protein